MRIIVGCDIVKVMLSSLISEILSSARGLTPPDAKRALTGSQSDYSTVAIARWEDRLFCYPRIDYGTICPAQVP